MATKTTAFWATANGAAVAAVLSDPLVIAQMIWAPDKQSPVRALNAPLARMGVVLSHTERQHVGRRVRKEMATHRLRVRAGPRDQFAGTGPLTSGAFYEEIEPLPMTAVERLERVQAFVAGLGYDIGSSDDLIAERREAFRREQAED